MEAASNPQGAHEPTPAQSDLPNVQSPSISPGADAPAASTEVPDVAPHPATAPPIEPVSAADAANAAAATPASWPRPRFVLRMRHKLYAALAASVVFAAGIGAVTGAVAVGAWSKPARPQVAFVEENRAMQQSIARLGKEITALKASLEQANRSTHTQMSKMSERLEHAAAEITGSISAPRTTAPQAAPQAAPLQAKPEPVAAPKVATPLPRPAPMRAAAAEPPPPVRPHVVPNWSIYDTRGGYVYVENRGDVFQVVPGAPLPGLGPVESVKRIEGRWVVTTPRGIIVSLRDRRYFE